MGRGPMPLFSRFLRDTRAATSIEYAMIAAFLSVLIIAGATAIGTRLQSKFVNVSNNLS